jgi:hypothetical protein
MNNAVKEMFFEDTLEVTEIGHKYMNTPSKEERSGIHNTNDKLEPSTSFQTHLTKHSATSKEFTKIDQNGVLTDMGNLFQQDVYIYDNNCYQAEGNNDVTQEDQQNDEKVPTKSKCQIQPENNLISSVFFCSEGCFQQNSHNKVVTGDFRT